MNDQITYDQIKGAIGSLLFLWADIERAVRADLCRINGATVHKSTWGIAAALNAWETAMQHDHRPLQNMIASRIRAELQRPLDIRNGVCHGLRGFRSGQSATVTWELNEEETTISWDELHSVFDWLSVAPRAISIVSNAAFERDDAKSASMLPGREWWKTEYAFDLPVVPVPQNYSSRGLQE